MTIALSSDFLLAFSNIQKGHQKQVREFIERFRERPDGPGLNYEVIQSAKGKDLYSVRINQAYRAVVFHPSNSQVYVLSWVDNHDDAYRWAERKQFVVHPATGALQMLVPNPRRRSRHYLLRPLLILGCSGRSKTSICCAWGSLKNFWGLFDASTRTRNWKPLRACCRKRRTKRSSCSLRGTPL